MFLRDDPELSPAETHVCLSSRLGTIPRVLQDLLLPGTAQTTRVTVADTAQCRLQKANLPNRSSAGKFTDGLAEDEVIPAPLLDALRAGAFIPSGLRTEELRMRHLGFKARVSFL